MKVTFEFDTNNENFYNYNDHNTLYRMQTADDMAICLEQLREAIRNCIKWDERENIPKNEIEYKFFDIIKDNNINFEKMGY